MKFYLTTALLACSSMLTACATVAPPDFDDTHSRAYNLSEAAGLYPPRLEDTEVPAEMRGSLIDNGAYRAAAYSSILFSPIMGTLTAIDLFSSPDPFTRNSLFAWMPVGAAASAEEASVALEKMMTDAASKGVQDFGGKLVFDEELRDVHFFHIEHEEWGCPARESSDISYQDKTCRVALKAKEPSLWQAPGFVLEGEPEAYYFSINNPQEFSFIDILQGESELPKQEVFASISSHLPEWAYLYLGENTVQDEEGNNYRIPVVMEQGQVELFIKP